MLQTWRWFGPDDPVSLTDVRQAGAHGVVTALHHLPPGQVWPLEEIQIRKKQVAESGGNQHRLHWAVVESIPVHRTIQTGRPDRDKYIDAFRRSLENVAACGISTVCYNFMAVLDWSRTDLACVLPNRSRALRFQWTAMAAFDVHILERKEARADYDEQTLREATDLYQAMDGASKDTLTRTVLAGLPGSDRSYTLAEFRSVVEEFKDIGADELRRNLSHFLRKILPVAEKLGIRLAIHPDDPPFPILGLPRVVSTHDDLDLLFGPNAAITNGLTLCTGSFASRPDNDVVRILRSYAERIHFVHLRNVRPEGYRSFCESDHLDGQVDMYEVVRGIVEEEVRRRAEGRTDWLIPMRPDHGHEILSDLRSKTNPGYTAIGRLKGLAELRGLEMGIRRSMMPPHFEARTAR